MKALAERTNSFKDSIFAVMSKLALENNAINLSQGFPDFDGEDFVKEMATKAIQDGKNQYAPFPGILELRQEISHYQKEYYGMDYNPVSEISIATGATEAIFTTIMSLVNPKDEVIVFEPFYDSYIASIEMAGGIVVPVTLHAPDFSYDKEELKSKITSNTKLIIINTPHNPTGKIFSESELKFISEIATQNDLYVMSDEVYEFLTFDENKHFSIARFDGMKERTVVISSAGKTFGVTGWKVGWALSSEKLSDMFRKTRQYITFSVSTPMQYAVCEALKKRNDYLPRFKKLYQDKRDLFCKGLRELGFEFKDPEGTYFVMLPIHQKTSKKDIDFCRELIEKNKVATIPPSTFYQVSKEGEGYLRLCFAKKDETLREALKNLAPLK